MLPTERKSACLGLYRLGFFDGIGAAVERALKVNGLDTGAAGSTVCWRPREPGVYSPGPPTTPAGTGRRVLQLELSTRHMRELSHVSRIVGVNNLLAHNS